MAPRLLNCRGVGRIINKLSFDTLAGRISTGDAAEEPLEHAVRKAA